MKQLSAFTFALCIFCLTLKPFAQERLPTANNNSMDTPVSIDPQFKADIDEVALYTANRLLSCCSTWGGNKVYGNTVYSEVRKSSLDGSFSIPMTVGWYGTVSGNHYWIKGILKVDKEGNKKWLKISDSGGPFKEQGCGTNCSL